MITATTFSSELAIFQINRNWNPDLWVSKLSCLKLKSSKIEKQSVSQLVNGRKYACVFNLNGHHSADNNPNQAHSMAQKYRCFKSYINVTVIVWKRCDAIRYVSFFKPEEAEICEDLRVNMEQVSID